MFPVAICFDINLTYPSDWFRLGLGWPKFKDFVLNQMLINPTSPTRVEGFVMHGWFSHTHTGEGGEGEEEEGREMKIRSRA